MPPVKNLYDPFDDTTPVQAPWTASTGTVTETGGHADLACLPGFSTLESNTANWDLTDSAVNTEASQVPIDGTGSTQAFLLLRVDSANQIRIGKHGANLIAERVTTGPTFTNIFSITYSAVDHLWWQIRHDPAVGGGAGTIFYESSPNGITWTVRGSHLVSVLTSGITAYNTHLRCGHTAAETDPGLVRFEGVNTIRNLRTDHIPTAEQVFTPGLRAISHLALDHIATAEQVFSPGVTAAGTATLPLPHFNAVDEVIFSDGFDGGTLGPDWFAHTHGGGAIDAEAGVNGELQFYLPANATVADSLLTITAKQEPHGGAAYTSALITTAEQFSFLYGRVEVRAKLPGGGPTAKGYWPSVFLLENFAAPYFGGSVGGFPGGTQQTGGWPTPGYSEADLLEHGGSRHGPLDYHVARHAGATPNNPVPGKSTDLLDQVANGIDLTQTFNVYAWVWTPDYIAWEFNGVEFFRLDSTQTTIPAEEMFLIANFAVAGGQFEQAPDGGTVFPAEYQIDWIRVTQPQQRVFAPALTGDGQISVSLGDAIPTAEQVFAPASIEHFVPPPPPTPPAPEEFRDHQVEWRGLRMGQGTSYIITKLDGLLDRPPLRTSDHERLRRHGLLPGDDFLEGRTLTATIRVLGDTAGTFQGNYQNLMAALAPVEGEQPLLLRYPTVAGGGQRLITCRPRRVATPAIYANHAKVVVQFDATDPRIYHPIRTDRTAAADTQSEGISFPLVFPFSFGVVGETGRVEVRNTGNFASPVRFVITGPCINPSITNTRTGQTLAFDPLELGNGEILVVDSDTRTVLRGGNTNEYAALASGSDWFDLEPGATSIWFQTEDFNSTATIRVTFHSAWIT